MSTDCRPCYQYLCCCWIDSSERCWCTDWYGHSNNALKHFWGRAVKTWSIISTGPWCVWWAVSELPRGSICDLMTWKTCSSPDKLSHRANLTSLFVCADRHGRIERHLSPLRRIKVREDFSLQRFAHHSYNNSLLKVASPQSTPDIFSLDGPIMSSTP